MLLGTGIYFTIATGCIQIRKMNKAFKFTFGPLFEQKKKSTRQKGEMSSFQSLATAIAAQVGTGNLAGVATAIAAGGPGAIFWMWVSGFFGMSTIFAEAVISQQFIQYKDNQRIGGPAYYIRDGLKNKKIAKFLSIFFAIAITIALGIMGNIVQTNSIAVSMETAFHVPPIITGIIIAILVMMIVKGGVKRITSVTEKVVPFMALFYFIGCMVIIILHAENILPTLRLIVISAFKPTAVVGGAIGVSIKQAFRYGVARGLFSNEAGMGSTPHAHALAKVDHPAKQGMVATIGVLIDTGIICTITALVILTTGALESGFTGAQLSQEAFRLGFGSYGTKFVATCLLFFAFSTIISWYFFGETNIKFLFGEKGVRPFRIAVVIFMIIGTLINVELVWELSDMFNALMVVPNLIALLALSKLVIHIRKDFEDNYLLGKPSIFQKNN